MVRREAEDPPEAPLALLRAERIAANPVAHLGISRPTVETLGDLLFRRLVVAGEALAVEAEALGSVVTATELDGVGTEFAQAPPLLGAILFGERAGSESVAGGDAVGEEVSNREVGVEVSGVLGKLPGERQGFLLEEPIPVAALLPLGEVLGADKFTGEKGSHDGLNLGKGVEPGGYEARPLTI